MHPPPRISFRTNSALPAVALAFALLCHTALPHNARASSPECEPPNVLLLLDISGSMGAASKPAGKYVAAVAAIDQIVTRFGETIRFGLMVFPDPSAGAGYCSVTTALAVDLGLNRGAAIRDYLVPGELGFFGGPKSHFDTPMKQALDAAGSLPELCDPQRRSAILLITDGMQDCCRRGDYDDEPDCLPGRTTLDPVEAADNRTDLRDTVADLAASGLPVFVVGFGRGVDALALNQMAVAAGTARNGCDPEQALPGSADACYHPADSTDELVEAMSAIAGVVYEEVCDGLDNNCNGLIDEGFGVGTPCDGDDDDFCADGVLVCAPDGGTQCIETTPPVRDEICDGLDNDCNGLTDEGLFIPCESACGRSIRRCVDGVYGRCEPADPSSVDACRPSRDTDTGTDFLPPDDNGGSLGRPDVAGIRIVDKPDAGDPVRLSGGGCVAGAGPFHANRGALWMPLVLMFCLEAKLRRRLPRGGRNRRRAYAVTHGCPMCEKARSTPATAL